MKDGAGELLFFALICYNQEKRTELSPQEKATTAAPCGFCARVQAEREESRCLPNIIFCWEVACFSSSNSPCPASAPSASGRGPHRLRLCGAGLGSGSLLHLSSQREQVQSLRAVGKAKRGAGLSGRARSAGPAGQAGRCFDAASAGGHREHR